MNGPRALGAGSRPARRVDAGFPLALIDRDEPWGLAAHALAAACAGQGSIVLLEGVEGFGKTTLLTSVRAHGDELGMDVLTASGQRHERDFGFGVVLQLFEARLAREGEEERARLWPRLVDVWPDYESYQRRTKRKIPVIVLVSA